MADRLRGKRVAITGTGSGQGRAAAILFAEEGAVVYGCDLNAETAEETRRLVESSGGEMYSTHPIDLSDDGAIASWIEEANSEGGGLDVLFNNASLPRFGSVEEMSTADWDFTIANELTLVMRGCQAVWKHFINRGNGAIINTASAAGMVAFESLGNVAHSAAKGGVIAMTRQMAAEAAVHGVRVNSISPGVIETEGTRRLLRDPERSRALRAKHMIPRLGTPLDVAYCALYLASDESTWVTGANFAVDGGLTAW